MKLLTLITLLLAGSALYAQVDTRINAAGSTAPDAVNSKDPAPAVDSNAAAEPERTPFLSSLEAVKRDYSPDALSVAAQFSEFADSTAHQTPQGPGFGMISQFGTQMQFQRTWRHASLLAGYSGGFSPGPRSSTAQNYQEVGLTQMFTYGRWHFLAGGRFTYLPESGFGFNAFRSILDVNLSLNPRVTPSQSVFTQPTTQFDEIGMAQADYSLSRLSSIVVFATYNRQTFDSHALFGNNELSTTLSYNHVLNARSSVAASYSFGEFGFDSTPLQFQTHSVQLFYGRRLSPQISLQLSAGPQLRTLQNTVVNAGIDAVIVGSADLDFQFKHTHLGLGYSRQTSGGSGVLAGSLVDQVTASADRDLSRYWHGAASLSYAHTGSLDEFNSLARQRFNSVYAAVRLERNFGRNTAGFISYGVQIQNSSSAASDLLFPSRQLVTLGLIFRPRSLLLHSPNSRGGRF